MTINTQSSGTITVAPEPRSRWFTGAIAGQLLGFTVAMVVAAPAAPVAVLASTLVGGFLGGLAGAKLKSKPPLPIKEEKSMKTYRFQALPPETVKKLDDSVDEEFNSASGNSGSRNPKQVAKPQLKPPTPMLMTPKMGGH